MSMLIGHTLIKFVTFVVHFFRLMIFQKIARFILHNRLFVLISVGIITAFMAYNIFSLKFNYEPTPLLPATDSLLIKHRHHTEIFGKGENLMVIGVQDSNFFTTKNLTSWKKLQEELLAIDGVEQVFSIIDIFSLGKDTEKKEFTFSRVFPEDLNLVNIDSLKAIAFDLPIYESLIYNKQTGVYLMMVSLRYDKISTPIRVPFMKTVVSTCQKFEQETGKELRYSGLPYIRITVGEMIKGEMVLFIFLAALITVVIIYLLFKSFRITAFVLLVVSVSVIWGLGIMSLLGYQITLLTAVIPPLIIVIGVPNCVYLLNKYHHEYSIHGNKIKALHRVIQNIGSATFLTNLTTAAGFGTLIFTSIPILVEFGLVAAIDIMDVFLVSLLLIPTIFSFLPPPEPKHLKHLNGQRMRNVITRVVSTALYHRKMVFMGTVAIVLISFWGVSRIQSLGFMVDDIPKKHPAYIDLKFFEKNFTGVMPLEIVIDTDVPKGILQEKTLTRVNALQKQLQAYPELSKPLSVAEAAKFARQGYYNGKKNQYKIPSGFERNFIMAYLPKKMGGNEMLKRFADSTAQITRIVYNVADIGSIRIKSLEKEIRTDADSIFQSDASKVEISGGSVIAAKGNDYLVKSLFTSLLAAIVIISVFMTAMFKKLQMVLLSILPNLIPLLFTAAAMGFLGIPLKPSTVIVFSIAFGISVDSSIHFLSKYRQELLRTQQNKKVSIICAIRETGVSMIYTSVVLFFGFGIFICSQFGGTVSLGLLVSLTLLIALFSNLILLPSVLLSLLKYNK